MDDLFIQEEVVVKTEPDDADHFNEKFLLGIPCNDDLMHYLNHSDSKGKEYNKKDSFSEDVDSSNIFGVENQYMDPNCMIAHYEEVSQEPHSNSLLSPNSLLSEESDESVSRKRKTPKSSSRSHQSKKGISRLKKDTYLKDESLPELYNYECSLCLFVTANESELKIHMFDHITGPDSETFIEESFDGNSYTCLFCPFLTVTKDIFRDHIRYNHSKPPKTARKKNLKSLSVKNKNLDSVDDQEPFDSYFCKFCNTPVNSESAMKRHLQKYHSHQIFKCSECKFIGFNKSSLKKHTCLPQSINRYSSNTLSDSNKHQKQVDRLSEKVFPCNECSFKSKSREGLKQHKKIHSDELPFSCNFCSYKACKKSRIVRHERIHTGERPYVCSYCNFKCNQGSTLKIHVRRHTGEKPYQCNLCSYRAVSKCSLNAHTKKHNSGENLNLVCTICDQIYHNIRALRKHEQSHRNAVSKDGKGKTKRETLEEVNDSVEEDFEEDTEEEIPQKSEFTFEETDTTSFNSRLYKCTFCSSGFERFSELNEHILSHSKVHEGTGSGVIPKQYRCTPCNMSFSKKDDMTKHVKEKHEAKSKYEPVKYDINSETDYVDVEM